MTWATKCRVGDASEKLLLLTLANYANEAGESWYSQERLSFDTEIPERTLRRKLQALTEKGLIEVIPRRREDGQKTSSLIRLVHQPANLAAGTTGQKEAPPPAKNPGQPPATCMAGQESTGNPQEPKIPKRSKKSLPEYTDDFVQSIWQPYPRKTNTSKINAFKKWAALSESDQALLRTAIPTFALAKRGTEEKFIPHLEFFISRRIFETVAVPGTTAAPDQVFDRQTWENLSKIYASDSNWRRQWGPEPGERGCKMPPDLQQKFVNPGLTQH